MCIHFGKNIGGKWRERERTEREREREREREIQEKTGPRTATKGHGHLQCVGEGYLAEPQDQKTAGQSHRGGLPPYRRGDSPFGKKKSRCEGVDSNFIARFARLRAFPYVQTGLPTAREGKREARLLSCEFKRRNFSETPKTLASSIYS